MLSYLEQAQCYTLEQGVAKCMEKINQATNNMSKLNIIVIGKTGVGKSTLINAVFGEEFAAQSTGRPVTQKIRNYVNENIPLRIFDTPGLELEKEQQEKLKEDVLKLIRLGVSSFDNEKGDFYSHVKKQNTELDNAIHCIWYCINAQSSRIEESELQWLKEFTEENKENPVPVFIVLTQSFFKKRAEELKREIEKENMNLCNIIPVVAKPEEPFPAYGLINLIAAMEQVLPEQLKVTLINVQKVSLKMKKNKAQATVATAVTSAVAAGATPIPVADAAVLVPLQFSMLAAITAVFGLHIPNKVLTCFLSATIGSAGATFLGRTIVSGLLKLIPGAGTVAGSAISGGTAGVLTAALGEAYIAMMEMIYKGEINQEEIDTPEGKQKIRQLFLNELKKKK